jgi:putative tryptophan/tyrosine transport system substrate-binding protein
MMILRAALTVILALGLLGAPLAAQAQPAGKVWRIGFLGLASPSIFEKQVEALRAGLRDLGYLEGKNVVIEYRWAEGKYDRLSDLAGELVRLGVDVLVTHGTPGALAAKRATTTIPIVVATSADAVASGIVESLSRPGGNVTGLTYFIPELNAKRLEIFKEIFPRTGRMAILVHSQNPAMTPIMQAVGPIATAFKIGLQQFPVRGPDEFEAAFSAMTNSRVDAVVIIEDPTFQANAGVLAGLAVQKRLPSTGFKEFAEAGGLLGYGIDIVGLFRRAAYFVDRILKGAKPGELPVERPTKFDLVVNLRTAKALGLTIPPSLLLRADQVIE